MKSDTKKYYKIPQKMLEIFLARGYQELRVEDQSLFDPYYDSMNEHWSANTSFLNLITWKRYPCCRRLPFIYLKGTHRFFVLRGYKIPQCAGNRTAEKRRCTDFRGQFLVSGAGARRSSARTLGWHGLRQCRMQRE